MPRWGGDGRHGIMSDMLNQKQEEPHETTEYPLPLPPARPGVETGTRRHVKSMAPETEPC